MSVLPKPSPEQRKILDYVANGYNVIVEALAGAGKTTLLLQMLLENPGKRGFMISYNRGLVDETNAMITKIETETKSDIRSRILVVTYHSLLSMIANKVVDDDLLFLLAMLETDFLTTRENWKHCNFDFVVVDEGQDMRNSYFGFFMNLIIHCCLSPSKVQIIAVGDAIQLLYDFYAINRADSRFLTCLDQLLVGTSTREWKHASLTTSYRSTGPMAKFINALFKHRTTIPKPLSEEERKKESPVCLIVCDLYKDVPGVIASHIKPNDDSVLILCSSLNEKSPAVGIVDLLVSKGLNVHVARSGNLSDGGSSHINQSTTQNKILLKTICGAKGLEADKVFALMQNNPFEYYKKPLTNKDYVELTRAKKELFSFIDYRNVTIYQIEKFIKDNPNLRQKDVRIIVMRDLKEGGAKDDEKEDGTNQKEEKQQTNFTSNTLFSFIDVTHLQSLLKLIQVSEIQPRLSHLCDQPTEQDSLKAKQMEGYFHQMNVTYDQGLTYINVTNICGLALTMALEYTVTKCTPLLAHKMYYTCLSKQNDDKYNHLRRQLESTIQELRNSPSSQDAVTDTLSRFKIFAKMGALFDAFSGYSEKLHSLRNYDFINKPSIFERYRALFGSLLLILSKHEVKINELVWYREETGRFKYDDKSITINVKPTIITKTGNLLIDIVHAPSISHEHHLSALIAAQIAGDTRTNVYILNIGDGSIECSKLHLLDQEPKNKETTTEDLETILEAQHFVKKNNQESMNFISSAITFKLCKDESPDDGSFVKTFHKLVKTSIGQRKLQDMKSFSMFKKTKI